MREGNVYWVVGLPFGSAHRLSEQLLIDYYSKPQRYFSYSVPSILDVGHWYASRALKVRTDAKWFRDAMLNAIVRFKLTHPRSLIVGYCPFLRKIIPKVVRRGISVIHVDDPVATIVEKVTSVTVLDAELILEAYLADEELRNVMTANKALVIKKAEPSTLAAAVNDILMPLKTYSDYWPQWHDGVVIRDTSTILAEEHSLTEGHIVTPVIQQNVKTLLCVGRGITLS